MPRLFNLKWWVYVGITCTTALKIDLDMSVSGLDFEHALYYVFGFMSFWLACQWMGLVLGVVILS